MESRYNFSWYDLAWSWRAVSKIKSVWKPFEDKEPLATELMNEISSQFNEAVNQLKQCMDVKITNLYKTFVEERDQFVISYTVERLVHVDGAAGTPKIEKIKNLYEYINLWIPGILSNKDNYLQYENLLPVYGACHRFKKFERI